MTGEPQKSLAGYKSKVHEQGEFENPNEGKPPLNDSEEYVMRLTEFPHVKTFPQIKENKKTGERKTVQVDKAICIFEDEVTHNIVTAFFRVDSLNFSEDEAFESGIVRFFKKIKAPLPETGDINWTDHFLVGMRFRGRVAVGVDDKKVPNGKYFLDIPTCRPILSSDKSDAGASQKPDASLANALLLAKGSQTHQEAMDKLQNAGASKEVVMALFQAHLDGKVKYPIA
jgi:hypothetical protein